MSLSVSPMATAKGAPPKRKRGGDAMTTMTSERRLSSSLPAVPTFPHLPQTIFSFEPPSSDQEEQQGSVSPRTRVANKFRDLTIDARHSSGAGDVDVPRATAGGSTGRLGPTADDGHGGQGQGPRPRIDSRTGQSQSIRSSSKYSPEPPVFDFEGTSGAPSSSGGEWSSGDNSSNNRSRSSDNSRIIDYGGQSSPQQARKRLKMPDKNQHRQAQMQTGDSSANAMGPVHVDVDGKLRLEGAVEPVQLRWDNGKLEKSYPSINRLVDSHSRGRRPGRTGTPPLGSSSRRKKPSAINFKDDSGQPLLEDDDDDSEPAIVDPVRAALTWHEDEITVYDSEDKDDDGVGLNGIGFKPTPAAAAARAQKRRQQLSEYRKREENDARARRNARRREQLGGGGGEGGPPGLMERKHSMVRVRFEDAEPGMMATT